MSMLQRPPSLDKWLEVNEDRLSSYSASTQNRMYMCYVATYDI